LRKIDLNTWNRKQHFEHFIQMSDPYFAVTIPFDVTLAYEFSKDTQTSFFGTYLHACMKAINATENMKYRIVEGDIISYDIIHASPTIMKTNGTFAFSFIHFDERLETFIENLNKEKLRIEYSMNLFPPQNSLDCIYCSAMPWLNFSGHKEPVSGNLDSVPKLAFSKMTKVGDVLKMNIAVSVNHALVDGNHVALFAEKFQDYLNK